MATAPAEKKAHQSEAEYFIRFKTNQRIEHIVLVATFVLLSVTGLAQKFYTAGWAQWVILGLGGIEYTRLIHRVFAFIFIGSVIYHLVYAINALFIRHARTDMVPTLKDFRDVIGILKHSFGLTEQKPQFGRFDYRQKFEYWGIIFGSVIIIGSGLFLMYPIFFTQVLPGQFVAAAKEFHGNEAMLAVLTIVVWHLYDVILKPGIFPADTSIYTGKISRERLLEEHPLEYAELTEKKPTEDAPPPPDQSAQAGNLPQTPAS